MVRTEGLAVRSTDLPSNAYRAYIATGTSLTNTETSTFSDLGMSDLTVSILERAGITAPFPIQWMTIPDAIAGRDVCGKAQTGSGKTLAFGLPIVDRVAKAKPRHPLALVLVPTRELCVQVAAALEPFLTARSLGLVTVYGGASITDQMARLTKGVEMVVATPGRLIDLLERQAVNLSEISTVVIDEADEMANMGFLPQVHGIMRHVPKESQVMLFSATLDQRVQSLVNSYLDDPVYHKVISETTTVETSEHRFLEVHHMDKPKVVARISAGSERTIVFVQTKRNCDRVAADLQDLGVGAQAIHGDIPQYKRERTLDRLHSGRTTVLVATNVAARGIHVDGLDLVIHYDPPDDGKTYLHRSGRTARAGNEGLVVTLVEWDQIHNVRLMQKEAGLHEPIVKMFSNDDRLEDLSDWKPEPLEPAKAKPRVSSRRRSRNRLL